MRSIRVVAKLLEKWRFSLTSVKPKMLGDYISGLCSLDCSDPFPNLSLPPNLLECTGIDLQCDKLTFLGPKLATGKALYKTCVKSLNKRILDKRASFTFYVLQVTINKENWGFAVENSA